MGEVTAPERPPGPNRHASPGTGVRVLPPLYRINCRTAQEK
ncbi:hypothetical protein [Streptomyces sp. NPDC015345]